MGYCLYMTIKYLQKTYTIDVDICKIKSVHRQPIFNLVMSMVISDVNMTPHQRYTQHQLRHVAVLHFLFLFLF